MTVKEIQLRLDNPRFDPSPNFWLGEIAIQLAEANVYLRALVDERQAENERRSDGDK